MENRVYQVSYRCCYTKRNFKTWAAVTEFLFSSCFNLLIKSFWKSYISLLLYARSKYKALRRRIILTRIKALIRKNVLLHRCWTWFNYVSAIKKTSSIWDWHDLHPRKLRGCSNVNSRSHDVFIVKPPKRVWCAKNRDKMCLCYSNKNNRLLY